MQIAILVFPKLTALDAIGPYEVLSRLPGFELTFVGADAGELRTDTGRLGITADATIEEVTEPDVLLIPGGEG
ncbi:MAG TPA: DJ-1/PfpI family protein, partial [Solirubrobacterales bacterium]|nr:DJ-1/PfpI family protein [Solirubrobacterales bacterium]